MRLFVWLLAFLILSGGAVSAQESQPVRNFTSSDYDAQPQNWAIGQSANGLLYVGNSDGLLEFDGSEWRTYPFPNGQPVRSVLCDSTRVYVGGYGEFGYWEKGKDQSMVFTSLSAASRIKSAATEEIWNIIKTPKGIFFQSFASLFQLAGSGKNGTVKEIRGPNNFMFLQEVKGSLLLQVIGSSLYDFTSGVFEKVPGTDKLGGSSVAAILPYNDGELLVVTTKNGIFHLTGNVLKEWISLPENGNNRDIINKAIRLRNGSYAFGTALSGVYIVSGEGSILANFNTGNGLQNNSVLNLFQDKQENLWVALDKGIDLISLSSPFSQYRSETTPLEATYSVELWKGKLYVGTNRGVFWKKWQSAEPFRPLKGLEGHVWELKQFEGQLLCGHSEGTYRILDQGIEQLSNISGGWTMLQSRYSAPNRIIQGTYTGLSIYQRDKSGSWKFSNVVKGIPPIPIKYISETPDGFLWVAHAHRGLYRAKLSPDGTKATQWVQVKNPECFENAFNVEITTWGDAPLFKCGIVYYRANKAGILAPVPGFPDPEVGVSSKLKEGIDGEFFKIFSNRVILVRKQGKTTIPVSLIRNHETIKLLDNRYYFLCTHNGYSVFDRARKYVTDTTLAPAIREISDQRNSAISFPFGNTVSIPPTTSVIQIHYYMPVFSESVRFRYKIHGFSTNWTEWSEQRFLTLVNLDPGEYELELENDYNDKKLWLSIKIEPDWHETPWMRLLFVVVAIFCLFGLYLWQERRIRAQRKKLIQEHEDKLRQRELAAQKLIVEIRNEQLATEINYKSQQLSNVAINVVRKNEILESIKNELVAVKKDLGQQLPNVHYQKLLDIVTRNLEGKEDWTLFDDNFREVHEEFFRKLKARHPDLTPSELRLAATLRMNLSTKEIAPILGISARGIEIKRYRLRKKMGLDEHINLTAYMMDI